MVASDPEPVFPGLSADDVLTLYFTRATNRPSVSSTAKVQALLGFDPPLASILRANWQAGPDEVVTSAAERLVITLSGTVNANVQTTLVAAVRVSVLRSGGLRDADNTCQNMSVANASLTGSWGDASQPHFLAVLPAIALDLGAGPGLGPGDAVALRFNQPVAPVPVASKAHLDGLLAFQPQDWADNYTGTWLDPTTLLVTAVSVAGGNMALPLFRAATRVGGLRVTVLPSGNLTSFDGTSQPSNASTLVSSGSWGDVVCDAALVVYSHKTLVAAFQPPPNASYSPGAYTVEVLAWPALTAPPGAQPRTVTPATSAVEVALPPTPGTPRGASALRYLLPGLSAGEQYIARVAVGPPDLPAELASVLPAPVPLVYSLVGRSGGCSCTDLSFGGGCSASTRAPVEPVSPALPSIGG